MLQIVLFPDFDLPLDPAVHAMDCSCSYCIHGLDTEAKWEAEILDWELGVMARIEAEVEASINR